MENEATAGFFKKFDAMPCPTANQKIPTRLCVSCRHLFPRDTLLGVNLQKDTGVFNIIGNTVNPWDKNKVHPGIQGRTAYVCHNATCLKEALQGKKIHKALKRAVPSDIVDVLMAAYEQLCSSSTTTSNGSGPSARHP